MNFNDYSMHLW